MPALRLLPLAAAVALFAGLPAPGDEPPPEVKSLLDKYDQDAKEIQKKADEEIQARRDKLIDDLQALREKYTKDGKLDEAEALRVQVRKLKEGVAAAVEAKPDPGNMEAFRKDVGKSFYFEVTGSTTGTLYGTDVYTSDSSVATAAVHAGVLKSGQKGVVKVTVVKSLPSYKALNRNGVGSSSWSSSWYAAFRVEAVKD
jgi:hypothetical protein